MKRFDNYINGEWVGSTDYKQNVSPSNVDLVLGEYAQASGSQVQDAIQAARAAFPAWAAGSIQQRADALDKIGSEILRRSAELGRLLAQEEGKVLPEAVGEVSRAGNIFKYFAGECLRLAGSVIPSVRPNVSVEVVREPVGVVGLITPWNFPIAIPAWKIAPALAYGNCVVFKPADLTPGCAWELANIIADAGLPAGVFNLVMGKGREVGNAIVESTNVDAISFTGSVQVGRQIAERCVARQAKVQLEMGGKNPQVVLDDADLDKAVELSLQSAYFSTGQRCTASSRLIVTEGIFDQFQEKLVEKMLALRVGDALDPNTQIGPVVSEAQLANNLKYGQIGKDEGATLHGGEALELGVKGFYQRPGLFVECQPTMRVCTEEIFGPMASLLKVRDYDEALAMANDTPFGLASGIATQSLKHAQHFKQHAQAGMVMVNLPTAGVDYHVPFGGRKGSSYGPREQANYAKEFYTVVKTVYIAA